jgi:hypothetical protein
MGVGALIDITYLNVRILLEIKGGWMRTDLHRLRKAGPSEEKRIILYLEESANSFGVIARLCGVVLTEVVRINRENGVRKFSPRLSKAHREVLG